MIIIKDKDISKKTVAVILSCAILLSIFSTFIVLTKEPKMAVHRYSTLGTQGQVGLTILEPPKDKGEVSIEIKEPSKEEAEEEQQIK